MAAQDDSTDLEGRCRRCTQTSTSPSSTPIAAVPLGESSTTVTLDGVTLDLFTYKPSGTIKGILLVFHGTNRNAAEYRTWAEPLARKAGFVVVAPLFDEARFSSTQYNRGNVLPGTARSTWTTRFVPLLTAAVKAREGTSLPVYMFGFSAGGQFVSRVAAFESLPDVVRIVGGGASTYVLPKLGSYAPGEAAPYGMGMLGNVGEAELTKYLVQPYSIIVGANDTDTSDPNLSSTDAALRQGTDRVDRARKTFALGQTVAAERGTALGWDLFVVPGVAHSASSILRSRELQEAMRLPSPAPL